MINCRFFNQNFTFVNGLHVDLRQFCQDFGVLALQMFQGEGDVFGVGREHVGSGIPAVSKWAHDSYCGRGCQRF